MELEVKFRTSAAGLKAALDSPRLAAVLETRSQSDRTIYFDTRTFELQKNGSTLRVRKSGRTLPVQCYKSMSSNSPFERREFEVRLREMLPDIALFDPSVSNELASVIGDNPLEPCFETIIHRRTRVLELGRSIVEVAFDKGVVKTSDQQVKLVELELELKTGTAEDLYAFAEQLCTELPLSIDLSSKAAKGYALRQNRSFSPSKAESANLPRASSWDDVVAATLAETLRHFVANWAALRTSDEPEAVHQMRVALRRMRSAFSIFSREIPFPQFLELGEKARHIASGLGPARECDVFRISAEHGPLASELRPAECAALMLQVEEQRKHRYTVARATIEDPATSVFVLQVQSMLARRSWSGTSSESQTTSHAESAEACARRALDRLWKRTRRRGRHFSNLGNEDRHRLRIALKSLRYGADFFSGMFHRPRRFRAFVSAVGELQDLLGAHNDLVATRRYLDTLASSPILVPDGARQFVLGWYVRDEQLSANLLPDAWKRLKKAQPFWR